MHFLSWFAGLSVCLLLTPSLWAQEQPLACAKGLPSPEMTEETLCQEDACAKTLATLKENLGKMKLSNRPIVKPDANLLKALLLLRKTRFLENTEAGAFKVAIESYKSNVKSLAFLEAKIKAYKANPARAEEMDRARIILLNEYLERLEKKFAGKALNQNPELSKEKFDLENEISTIQQIPKELKALAVLLATVQKLRKETQANLDELEQFDRAMQDVDPKDQELIFTYGSYYSYTSAVRTIKARPEFRNCGLSDLEIFAVNFYSLGGYMSINRLLHGNDNKDPEFQAWVNLIYTALSKLKNYDGVVKRGGRLTKEQQSAYQVHAIIQFPAFMSTSRTKGFPSEHTFTIHSRTGKYIAPLSALPSEEEVLMLPKTRFKVVDITGNNYVMDEVP